MTDNLVTPAAQYLRRSTEHQQYSLENQSAAIGRYGCANGFSIVHTYSDAKSGVLLKHRSGLRQLLQDVVSNPDFKAILVYDVSRWGRFQDSDESAHYEFVCKSAGVPVHYCAETFSNDGTMPSLMMKALKRTMAGEYSRELGVKVFEGQKRLALLGFKQGGCPGYGLRRVLVSPDRTIKQELASGERKSIATDRVILVPGPPNEVDCVREIYRMLLSGKFTVHGIASELNRRGTRYLGNSEWDYSAVHSILTRAKYAGHHVFNRTSRKLYTPTVNLPASQWIVTAGAFDPIVDQTTFDTAQQILNSRTINKSDAEVLQSLREALATHGRLSLHIIKNSPNLPSPSTFRLRFGGLRSAYEQIGYGRPLDFERVDLRSRVQAIRRDTMNEIATMFRGEISVVSCGGRWRTRLQVQKGRMISVLVSRTVRPWKDSVQWQVDPVAPERKLVTLLARLNHQNDAVMDYHILPNVDRRKRFTLTFKDPWLERGRRLELADFIAMTKTVRV